MVLLGGKKNVNNIKLDDYVENKISVLNNIVKENKTLITFTFLGSIYYIYKIYFNY